MTQLIELSDTVLDLVGGGTGFATTSDFTYVSVPILSNNGNHDGDGNEVSIGNDNGVNVFVPGGGRRSR